MIKKFNQWYDKLQEPWRFLLCMVLAMTGIVTANVGAVLHNYKLEAAGFLFIVFLIGVRMIGRYNATT
jgi:hypothetical protein